MSGELELPSFIISILGLAVSVVLTLFVVQLGNNQRNNDEKYYRHQTLNNIRTISQHVVDVYTLSTGNETRTTEELENNTIELRNYFKVNINMMNLFIQDCKFTLSKWITLQQEERKKISYMIESLEWIINTYFPFENKSDDLLQRIWTSHYDELETRKNKITKTAEYIITQYNN